MHSLVLNKWFRFTDALTFNMYSSQKEPKKVASFSEGENKPSDFLRIFYGM
jgi:hypothetical protein